MPSVPFQRLLRRLIVRSRHLARERLAGAYESAVRGSGLTFADVRTYQPGDDIRHIDWNVTARTGVPHIKQFVEEREQTIWLVVDASASVGKAKRRCAAEVAALIAFAASARGDRVGLIHFSDRPEETVLPKKGDRHTRRIVRSLFTFQAARLRTSIESALAVLRRRRRAVVFLISDFLDSDFGPALRVAAKKHDLIAVVVRDPTKEQLPEVGLIQLADAESGSPVLLNTSNRHVREAYAQKVKAQFDTTWRELQSAGADRVEVSTAGGHLESLLSFFHRREQRR